MSDDILSEEYQNKLQEQIDTFKEEKRLIIESEYPDESDETKKALLESEFFFDEGENKGKDKEEELKKVLKITLRDLKSNEKFKDPRLLFHILDELGKGHLEDNKEKLACFIGACTSYLSPVELRKSIAFLGDSSVGKDNLIKTILKNIPKEHWLFLTKATGASLEDDIAQYKIIAFSELNTERENGANQPIVETLKQMTEGGTSSMKKDLRTNCKTVRHVEQEQKTVLFGTTESRKDEELETRFICASISASQDKINAVNLNSLDWFSGKREKTYVSSWIANGIRKMKYNIVHIPFLELDSFKELKLFDSTNPRSMRDLKRFLSFVSSIAWLHQLQREIVDGIIMAEPIDFLMGIIVCGDFFNQTYTGIPDLRVQQMYEAIIKWFEENKDQQVIPKKTVQDLCGIKTRKTCNERSFALINRGLIEKDYATSSQNKTFFKLCRSNTVQVPFITVHLDKIIDYFKSESYIGAFKNHRSLLTETTINMLKELQDLIFSVPFVENERQKMNGEDEEPKITVEKFDGDYSQIGLEEDQAQLKQGDDVK